MRTTPSRLRPVRLSAVRLRAARLSAARLSAVRLRALPVPPDVLLVAAFGLLDLVVWGGFPRHPDAGFGVRAMVVAYAAAGFVALLWRRRYPVSVFAVLWLHSMVAHQLSWLDYRPTVGVLVALYAVAGRRGAGVALGALLAAAVPDGLTIAGVVRDAPPAEQTPTLVVNTSFYLILSFTVWGLGYRARAARRQAEDLDYRRELATREAVHAERGWIARELHDTVAHAVTVIVLQAAGARRIIDSSPVRASQALETIEEVGKQTMDEMRSLLEVLHTGSTDGPASPPGYQLGLKDLDSLVRRIRAGGVGVRLQTEGEPSELDPGVDLAAYRTVQETLTNATRHSGPGTQVTVQLIWGEDTLVVQVTDDGSGAPPAPAQTLSTGHGLVGLGERIALLGGRLQAGPGPAGGFRVSVTLPVPQSD